ncbi:gp53-like domain-containing protein [Selenomonas ruminantium]|uniref:gp53-like domain-containing protein n=1 Tax=Selenomonas ruminantium TaxID=971 RepID=UPI003B006331
MEQWGTYEITSGNWKEYSFPIAFPNACYGVVTTPVPNAGTSSAASSVPATIASYTKTSFFAALSDTTAGWRFVAFALGE